MAGENDPIVGAQDAEVLKNYSAAVQESSEALGVLNSVGAMTKGMLGEIQSRISSLGIDFKNNHNLAEDQVAVFGLLTTSILGTRKAFDQLEGIDAKGLHTFRSQFDELVKSISGAPIAQQTNILSRLLKTMGMDVGDVDKAASKGKNAIMTLASSFFESADNGVRLQNAMIQLAAKTGNLNAVIGDGKGDLADMNKLLAQQSQAINDAAQATKNYPKDVQEYYSQLASIPKALNQSIATHEAAGESVSMLAATINYAKGSGRSYKDVIDDLKVAYRDYNIVGEPALKFTARMSELSNKFGIELSDVQNSLRETAGLFKMFGGEAEGAAKMVNNYLGALQSTGISGRVALEVINGMTQGIKGMSLAQKGFLSAQTGGAGGLMGAFQIEKLLRENKLDEVMEKVRQQMTKQFGRIVSVDEAAESPQAAAQLTKQMMILQQGPLGKFAKDDQSAIKILEAFKAREQGGSVKELSSSIVQDTMKTGIDLQEKSVTILDRIRELIESQQTFADMANYTTAQHGFAAGIGAPINSKTGDYNSDMRDQLRMSTLNAATRSADSQNMVGAAQDITGVWGAQVIGSYKDFVSELVPALKGPINKIKDLLKSGNTDDAEKEYQQFMADLDKKKEELKNAPVLARASGMKQIAEDEANMKAAYASLSASGGNTVKLPLTNTRMNFGAADAVNRAANRAVAPTPSGQPATAHAAHAPISGEITVQVEGYCLDCGNKMKNQQHRKSVSVGSSIDK